MAKNSIWCGFLDAGAKSSAVVRDERLDTGNPETIYLFNLARNEIIQYNRAIVEPKLRELSTDECDNIVELKAAYLRARRHFKVRAERPIPTTTRKTRPLQEKVTDGDDVYSTSEPEFEPAVEDDWDDSEEE
ncbi:MAG: hypothetical protein LBV36_03760 [Chromatiales bacterium]|jgi:hypothetical protein|nr:hypothetical protein [Chromatiales bacterium]